MGALMHGFLKGKAAWVLAVTLAAGSGIAARGQYRMDLPPDGPALPIPNPEIVDKANAAIPLELQFTRSDGAKLKLGDLFNHNRPVILSLVYFSCPNLCNFTQDDLANAVRDGPEGLKLGKDYDIVVVSIDPDDTPAIAAQKRSNYLAKMNRGESQEGFTYLTGSEGNIRTLADTVGYGFRRNFGVKDGDSVGKFAHSSGIFVCTSYGRLSQTILGINWPPAKLHFALYQAADGKIGGGFLETVLLPCGVVHLGAHGYESNPWFWAGTAGGGASVAFMAIFLTMMFRGDAKRRRQDGEHPPQNPPAAN
jgi:protein SCO1